MVRSGWGRVGVGGGVGEKFVPTSIESGPYHKRSQNMQNRTLMQPENYNEMHPGQFNVFWNAALGGLLLEWCWRDSLGMLLEGCSWNGAGGKTYLVLMSSIITI